MPSEHCQTVLKDLEEGKIPCGDFRATRSAAMCLAFDIYNKEGRKSLPLKEAWGKLKTKCRR
jgi:hypothetical protein